MLMDEIICCKVTMTVEHDSKTAPRRGTFMNSRVLTITALMSDDLSQRVAAAAEAFDAIIFS